VDIGLIQTTVETDVTMILKNGVIDRNDHFADVSIMVMYPMSTVEQ